MSYFVLVCRECEPMLPMPFESAEARGRWASEHTRGTGHDRWFVSDGDASVEETMEKLVKHDEASARVRSFFDSL